MQASTQVNTRRAIALTLMAVAVAGCATAPKREFVYPPPPDKARIEFVRSFKRPDDIRTSFLQRLWAGLVPYAPDTLLANPAGIALSTDERYLFVALPKSHRVVRVDLETGKFASIGVTGDRPLAVPTAVAVDGEDRLYVADKGAGAVVVYDKAGKEVLSLIGREKLKYPNAVAVDRKAQLLYVVSDAVTQEGRHVIETFSLNGEHLRTLGGGKGLPDGMFLFPSNVAVSPEGELFVADMLNFRIQVFDREGRFLRKFGEAGRGGLGQFDKIHGIAFDTFGNIYVADALQGVQILNPQAQGLMGFGGGALAIPMFLAIDRRNHIYASDLQEGIVEFRLINTSAEDAAAARAAPAAPEAPPTQPAPGAGQTPAAGTAVP
jgi:sugar lactone lactonase YvrE